VRVVALVVIVLLLFAAAIFGLSRLRIPGDIAAVAVVTTDSGVTDQAHGYDIAELQVHLAKLESLMGVYIAPTPGEIAGRLAETEQNRMAADTGAVRQRDMKLRAAKARVKGLSN